MTRNKRETGVQIMDIKKLFGYTDADLLKLENAMVARGELFCARVVYLVRMYHNKRVKVVKGRKVPLGTEGNLFWMGTYCRSPYGDPWGIYTSIRVGIKDDAGNVHWTSVDNIELA